MFLWICLFIFSSDLYWKDQSDEGFCSELKDNDINMFEYKAHFVLSVFQFNSNI